MWYILVEKCDSHGGKNGEWGILMEFGETVAICSTLKKMMKLGESRLSRQNGLRFKSSGGKTRYRLADIYRCWIGVRCFQFHSQTGIWKQKSVRCLSSPQVMFKSDSSYSQLSGFHVNYPCIMCASFLFGEGENRAPHSSDIQGDSERSTQFRTSIFPQLYMVCEWST
jgi:hypothetical protein